MIDAKTSINQDLTQINDLTSSCTPNQQIVYKLIDGDNSVGYTLSNATIEGTTLFEKQLANGVEVVDEVSKKYLKYDRYSGDVLVGKFSDNAEKEILFEKNGKLYNAPQNASDEALAEWVINNVN